MTPPALGSRCRSCRTSRLHTLFGTIMGVGVLRTSRSETADHFRSGRPHQSANDWLMI